MADKICCFCKSFYFDMGEDDWSEYTPGHDAEISCQKGHWEMTNMNGTEDYRKAIQQAATCPDWEFFKDPIPEPITNDKTKIDLLDETAFKFLYPNP